MEPSSDFKYPEVEGLKGTFQGGQFRPAGPDPSHSELFSIQAEQSSQPLRGLKSWFWVQAKMQDGNPILLNIASISKATGLTRQEIRTAANAGKLAEVLNERLEQAVELAPKVMGSMIAHGIKADSRPGRDRCAVSVVDDRGNSTSVFVNIQALARQLGVTPRRVQQASNRHRLVIKTGIDDDGIATVHMQLLPEKLQKLVLRAVAIFSAVKSAQPAQPTAIPLLGGEQVISRQLNLKAMVSPAGEVFLIKSAQMLGAGVSKDVFKGIPSRGEKPVAVAITRGEGSSGEVFWNRAFQGKEGLAQSRACFQLKIGADGRVIEGAQTVFISKLYNGGNLSENLAKIQGQPEPQKTRNIAFIFHMLAKGMRNAHTTGAILRDIKPANVFLEVDEQGDVLDAVHGDFGLTIRRDKLNPSGSTVAYYSPQQLRNPKAVPIPSDDMWALGTVLSLLLGEETPWVQLIENRDPADDQRVTIAGKIDSLVLKQKMEDQVRHWLNEPKERMIRLCHQMLRRELRDEDVVTQAQYIYLSTLPLPPPPPPHGQST